MQLETPFEVQETGIFGIIRRPVAQVNFWSDTLRDWVPVKMIVDTGADYTLLPVWLADKLGINIKTQCREFRTSGVGGDQKAYLVKERMLVRLGKWNGKITLGFIDDHQVPPLLGRSNFLEKIKVTFYKFKTTFEFEWKT